MTFGPEYPKINGVFKRDQSNHNVITPGDWSQPEFQLLADVPWRWTEKVDGTNIRLHWDGSQVHVGGRTKDAQVPTHLLDSLRQYFDPEPWVKQFGEDEATVYGEGYGAKIQKGGGNYIPDGQDFIVFDVVVGRWWLKDEDVADIASNLGMRVVPAFEGTLTLNEAVEFISLGGPASAWANVIIEGVVGKPAVDLFDRGGHRIIAKVKLKDFEDLRRWAA